MSNPNPDDYINKLCWKIDDLIRQRAVLYTAAVFFVGVSIGLLVDLS